MTVHSSEINLYKCTECGAVFSLETNLRRHIQMTHTLTRFKCQYCGREFKRKDYLKGHLETVHPDLYKSLKPKKNGVEEKVDQMFFFRMKSFPTIVNFITEIFTYSGEQ
jgi:uncharacterized C2H2 Zn-finger protein